MSRYLLLPFLTAISLVAAPFTAAADRIDYLPGLAPADHYEIHVDKPDRSFHLFVRLPEGYSETDATYPVVYALDGDILFPILGAYHLLLAYDEPVPEAIIVGIGYGAFGADNGNYRATDYSTPPLPEDYRNGIDDGGPDGGAARFQDLLRNEFIPLIEKHYRADPTRRILLGQSRGAHFVLYSAVTEPDLFWGRIASNPALHPNQQVFFRDYGGLTKSGGSLYFANGTRDWERLRTQTLKLFDHLAKQPSLPWRLRTQILEGETHAAGITNVYRDAMIWLFANENTKSSEDP